MTDEELADIVRDAYDRARPFSWVQTDDLPEHREMQRVEERWRKTVREVRHRLESSQREQTAATLLAALVRDADAHEDISVTPELGGHTLDRVRYSVALADALRARLAKVKP